MKKTLSLALALSVFTINSEINMTASLAADDPYIWLEEVKGEEALDWVRARNEVTMTAFGADARFAENEQVALDLLNAKDRIPYGRVRGGQVYNFWQDETNTRGLWRRASLASYKTDTPEWEVLIDMDALAKAEDKNWVYHGVNCLAPDYSRCMVTLSPGGSDAAVLREFDLETLSFVEDGFFVDEAKNSFAWLDRDTVLLRTDFGEGSLTKSGYGRILKLWKRGTPLTDAKVILEATVDDISVFGFSLFSEGSVHGFGVRSVTFFEREWFLIQNDSAKVLPIPLKADLEGIFKGQILVSLRQNWDVQGQSFRSGSLISFEMDAFVRTGKLSGLQSVYEPGPRASLERVGVAKDRVYLAVLDNVVGRGIAFDLTDEGWQGEAITLPDNGTLALIAADVTEEEAIFSYEGFLVPNALYMVSEGGHKVEKVKSLPAKFDAAGLIVEQREVVSKDGTKVPYFMVSKEGLKRDGTTPTLLYGYGGFQNSMTPNYSVTLGNLWLEKGGAYALANIRGGGEFGPEWHQAGLKHNRQKVFDDFYAIAEDLTASRITAPEHLGIMGGSNGGLLVGVAMTQRPDLFNAVVCQVPLLDMMRYSQLLAGASWVGEYGDPDVPEERATLLKYSPYQNLKADGSYPKALFYTSTKDDRVHPGHARKMAALMEEMGHEFYYYENIEGGHSAGANLKQTAKRIALEYTYLAQQLGLE